MSLVQVRSWPKAGVAPVEADWQKLVDLPDVGLAYVFGPHDGMAEKCLALIERGIPFVVEKPLGTSLDELLRCVRPPRQLACLPLSRWSSAADPPTNGSPRPAGPLTSEPHLLLVHPPGISTTAIPGCSTRSRRAAAAWPTWVRISSICSCRAVTSQQHMWTPGSHRLCTARHVEDHASLIITTPDGREAIVEVGYAFPGSPLKRYCSFTSVGEAGFASVDSDGSATFTALDGTTESTRSMWTATLFTIRSCGSVARTLEDGFRGLPTLAQLEDVMRPIWQAYDDQHGGREHA